MSWILEEEGEKEEEGEEGGEGIPREYFTDNNPPPLLRIKAASHHCTFLRPVSRGQIRGGGK